MIDLQRFLVVENMKLGDCVKAIDRECPEFASAPTMQALGMVSDILVVIRQERERIGGPRDEALLFLWAEIVAIARHQYHMHLED